MCARNKVSLMIPSKYLSTFRVPYHILKLKKSQHQRPSDLEKAQSKKLRKIVRHTYYHVPYYHFLFKKAGIKPSDIRSATDLTKLPTVSKAEFVQNWGGFISNTAHPEKCKIFTTSGTTGTPLRILKNRVTEAIGYALTYYIFFECGMHLTDRFLELTLAFPSLSKSTFRHGPGGLMKGYYLSLFNDPAANVEEILKINPDVIYSFPSALEYITQDFSSEMKNLKPRLLFTQSEMLTKKVRKLIENLLNIIPNDTYGSREISGIAFECNEHQGLHVIADWVILELVKDGENVAPNEEGETIITSLYNYAMPFIRYKLGDLAVWADDECTCGRVWPLLKALKGRLADTVILPSRRRIPSVGVEVLIRAVENVKRFQIVQRPNKDIIMKVVVDNKKMQERIQREIIRRVKLACLNEDVNVQVRFVEAILPQASGKTPDFIRETL